MAKITQQIPAGWKVMRLNDFANIIMGQSPPSSAYNQDGKGLPFFQGKADFDTKHNHPVIRQWSSQITKIAPADSILFTVRAPVGDIIMNNIEACIGRGLASIEAKNGGSNDFLFYYLQYIGSQFEKYAQGSTFTAINSNELKNYEINVPTLKEQTKIAAILSKVDEEIEKVGKIIGKTEKLKEGLMQKLLTKGIGHTKFKKTELGEIPEEWEVVKLNQIVDKLQAGVSVNSENRVTKINEIGILKTSAVTYGKFDPLEHKTVIEKDLDRVSTEVEEDSIIISRMNTPLLVGASCYIDSDYHNLFLPDRLWKVLIKDKKRIFVLWLSYLLGDEGTRERIRQIATGTSASMKNISKEKLLNLSIVLPRFKEQKQIAKILYTIDNKISTNQKVESQLSNFKKGLMSDLLSGIVRV